MKDTLRRWLGPLLATFAALALAVTQLRMQGRSWWCACGRFDLWSGDIWSACCSQHLIDPYSFTHILHGMLFCGALALVLPRLAAGWRFFLALAFESLWEIAENSDFVIHRYREMTIAIGYEGDSIINSLGDLLFCGVGFLFARRLGWKKSLVFFIVTEFVLLFWIRDNLSLNILMLLHPIDAVKTWQLGH